MSDNPTTTFYDGNGKSIAIDSSNIYWSPVSSTSSITWSVDPTYSAPLLFGTWISQTKELQEQFYGKRFEEFDHQQLVEWVRNNVLAAEDELHEALGEISWKPWASAQFFNREAYLGEIVDVLHFIGNLLAGAGFTDAELNSAYLEKMERNRERQRRGYTGTAKCSGCKRAKDDIIAHGGTWVDGDDSDSGYCGECFNA